MIQNFGDDIKTIFFVELGNKEYSIKKGINENEYSKISMNEKDEDFLKCNITFVENSYDQKFTISQNNYKKLIRVISQNLTNLSLNSTFALYFSVKKGTKNQFLNVDENLLLIQNCFINNLEEKIQVVYYTNFLSDYIQTKLNSYNIKDSEPWVICNDNEYTYVTLIDKKSTLVFQQQIENDIKKYVDEQATLLSSKFSKSKQQLMLSKDQKPDFFMLSIFFSFRKEGTDTAQDALWACFLV